MSANDEFYNLNETEQEQNKDRKKRNDKVAADITNAAVVGATVDTVTRFGTANKQFVTAYSGVDNTTGARLHQSLKSVSESKVNPNYAKQNIKQQAGYSAEILSVADSNAESAAHGKPTNRGRTDDHGSVNDQLYDTMEYDTQGNPIAGSGAQIKFVGSTPEDTLSKLASKRYEKYLEADAKLEIPSDKYDSVVKLADEKINSIKKQLQDPNVANDPEKLAAKKRELEKYTKIRKKLHKSSVSTQEAEFARKHPKLATAQRIAKYSHRAGVEGAKFGAGIGGTVSVVQNMVAMMNDEVEFEDAVANVVVDTAKSAASGYATAFGGAAIGGVMQNAKNEGVRTLAKTAVPGTMVQVAIATGKTVNRWINGEIDGTECFRELGQEGTNMLSGSMFAAVGQLAVPIPVIGALAGSMVGYTLSSCFYASLSASLQEAKQARDDRVRLEHECEEQIKLIRKYRADMEQLINKHLTDMRASFDSAFYDMKKALLIGDVDGYVQGANKITRTLGGKPVFETFDEFDALMLSNEDIIL